MGSLSICVQKFKNNDYDVTLAFNVGALMALVVAIAIGHQDTHRYYGILYLTPIFSASNFLASKIQDLGRLVSLLLVPVLISLSGHLFFLGNSYGSKNQRYLEFQNLDGHVASLAGSQERPILGFCPFWIGQQINYFSTTAYCIPYEKREQAIIPNRWFVKDSYWDGIRHGKIRFIIENVQPSAMSSIPKENLVILDGTTLYVKRPSE